MTAAEGISMLLAIFIYTLPTVIAFSREHDSKGTIAILNIFIGWTVIGWVISLIWSCTRCNQSTKSSKFIKFIAAAGISIVVFAIFGSQLPSNPETNYQLLSPDNYASMNYRDALLSQISKDTPIRIEGRIMQKINSKEALMATKKSKSGSYYGDNVFLKFHVTPEMVEDDIVVAMGRYKGTMKYATVLKATEEVPYVSVDYAFVTRARD